MAEPSPVVARWELSRRLAARRKELGVDVKTITDALGFTRNYWSAVENDRTLIAEDKLRLLFDVLDFDDQDQAELLQLREDSRKRGWWDEYPSLSDDYKRFYGMEAGATRIRAYGGHLVPGILQTDAYVRSIISSDPSFSPVEVDRIVALRRRRQSQVLDSDPPRLVILISEAVLHQQVAGPVAQADQLEYIATLAANSDTVVAIRVLPFDVNPGAIVNSSTLLFFEYEKDHLPTLAWQEGVQLFGDIDADDEGFRRLDFAWHDAERRSLGSRPSLDMVQGAVSRLRSQPA